MATPLKDVVIRHTIEEQVRKWSARAKSATSDVPPVEAICVKVGEKVIQHLNGGIGFLQLPPADISGFLDSIERKVRSLRSYGSLPNDIFIEDQAQIVALQLRVLALEKRVYATSSK